MYGSFSFPLVHILFLLKSVIWKISGFSTFEKAVEEFIVGPALKNLGTDKILRWLKGFANPATRSNPKIK
jgi:hypothetical protein